MRWLWSRRRWRGFRLIDTALILRLREAVACIGGRLDALIAGLADAAERYADTPMAARTRSQSAVPTSFGLRIAGWLAPLLRCRARLVGMRPRLLVVQMGGAAGTLGVFGDRGAAVMAGMADALDLERPLKPWHSERDSVAEFAGFLSLLSGCLGKMAGDMILMGRSESGELRAGQGGGSSTMPQKANPVLAEAITAIARFNAGQVGSIYQAMLHAEERDGAAWALEWMALPSMVVATGAALSHAVMLADDMVPDADRMRAMLGDDTRAEVVAFALAAHMPLADAQAIVKLASRDDAPLLDAVERRSGITLDRVALKDARATLGTARSMIAQVVTAAREKS